MEKTIDQLVEECEKLSKLLKECEEKPSISILYRILKIALMPGEPKEYMQTYADEYDNDPSLEIGWFYGKEYASSDMVRVKKKLQNIC